MTAKTLDTAHRKEIERLVAELVDFVQGCYAGGQEPRINDFSPVSAEAEQRSNTLDRLLELTGVPRLCSAEVLYRLFDAMDELFEGERKLPPESIRRKLLSGLGQALDQQEQELRQRVEGVLVLLRKAADCALAMPGETNPERRKSLERIVIEGNRIRAHLIDFMVSNPSLMTTGVQSLFGDEDDSELVKGLIDSCGGQLDFIAQSGIISSQARIRANHVNNAFRQVSQAGMAAIDGFDHGLMELVSLLEFDGDWDVGEISRNNARIEQKIKTVMETFDTVHRQDILAARESAEKEVRRYAPMAANELIANKTLNQALAGDIIQGEGRLHTGIRLLKEGIQMRRQELRKGWAYIKQKANESLEVEGRSLTENLVRLTDEHTVMKSNYDNDVLREDHFRFELDRVTAELEQAKEADRQQKTAHAEIRDHIDNLIQVQSRTMDRLLEQIEAVEDKLRLQTKEIFRALLSEDLNAQRQVEIIEFGDPELSLSLVINSGKRLSADAQVAVARTGNRQLQRTLLRGLQDQLVVYARRFIPSELLLEVFTEGDLNKGIYS